MVEEEGEERKEMILITQVAVRSWLLPSAILKRVSCHLPALHPGWERRGGMSVFMALLEHSCLSNRKKEFWRRNSGGLGPEFHQ